MIAVAYSISADHLWWDNKKMFYVDMEILHEGGIHPEGAGQILFLLDLRLPGCEDSLIKIYDFKLKGLGKHVAFWRSMLIDDQ
jgi:hypothetical protein